MIFLKLIYLIVLVGLLYPSAGFSKGSVSSIFDKSEQKLRVLSKDAFRKNFELRGNIFITDKKGRLLSKAKESRVWLFGGKGKIESNWSFKTPDIKEVGFVHSWEINEDGVISYHIRQYDKITQAKPHSSEVKLGKLIREEKGLLKDFSPVTWVSREETEYNIVVRFVPEVSKQKKFVEIEQLPISLSKPVVFDSRGNLWAQNSRSAEAQYIGMRTHRGQIAFSFRPFKGSKEIGFVEGGQITLNLGSKENLYLRSEKPILAVDKATRIYGIIDKNRKTNKVNSVFSFFSQEESIFLEQLAM